MKKSVLLAAGVCLLSSMTAFADPVTSVNAVGVTKVNLPVGFSMIACPFNAVGAAQGLSLDEMFGTNLPDGATIFVYDAVSGYVLYQYYTATGWVDDGGLPAGTSKILRGEGFWVYAPSAANISLAGEVPSSANGTNQIDLLNGFQLVSFSFPQEINILDSGLVPHENDTIFVYNSGGYILYQYYASMGWVDDGGLSANIIFKPNQGFWYLSYGSNTWNQSKTYTWP